MNIDIVRSKTGREPNRTEIGYIACCPGHDDSSPSFSIHETSDGKILLKCFVGCTTQEICSSLNLQLSDLFDRSDNGFQQTTRTVYSYTDEQGGELYRKIRIEPGLNGKAKGFYCEHDKDGKVIKNLKGCRLVLYKLPAILHAISKQQSIFLVEGEKDVNKLYGYGLIATTSLESLKWTDSYTQTLKNGDVVIL